MSVDKNNPKLRIAFFGTPEFAATSLDELIKKGYNVVVVITATDKKKGRGQKIQSSAVKDLAMKLNIPVLQPSNLKASEFYQPLSSYKVDLGVVVAFRMLPESVWNLPRLGSINLHASLLPDYRGAAPINWAIINGEEKTGLTTFFLKHNIDTGDIIQQREVSIPPDINAGDLHDVLSEIGADLLCNTVDKIQDDNYQTVPQSDISSYSKNIHLAPKLYSKDCEIDWSKPIKDIHNLIRGLSPYPCARTYLYNNEGEKKILKIYSASMTGINSSGQMKIETDNSTYLHISCADEYLAINELQIEGKKRMGIEAFLRGIDISDYRLNQM